MKPPRPALAPRSCPPQQGSVDQLPYNGLPSTASSTDVMALWEQLQRGAAAVKGASGPLGEAVTDDMIRAWLLAGGILEPPCAQLLEARLPGGAVPALPAAHAVIVAGGFGKRLYPLTQQVPKPMLPVGGRPLLERTIEHLVAAGVRRVTITTHYRAEQIREHFGDGSRFGVAIDYVLEETPLGTAGALRLVEPAEKTLLVFNGDILSRINIPAFVRFHQQQDVSLSVAVRQYEIKVPYGVVEHQHGKILRVREKPTLAPFVNAGIYLLEAACLGAIPSGQRCDMTDLMEHLLAERHGVAAFPLYEYWLDIGQPSDYEQANADLRAGRLAA